VKRFVVCVCALALLVVALAACSSSSSKSSAAKPPEGNNMPWPAPSNPLELAVKAGLVPEKSESLQYHVHSHIDAFIDGKPIVVPGGIGIDISSPDVEKGEIDGYPAYGGIGRCAEDCISPLHTHDATGTIHTESATKKNNTFGQFLTEWNVTLPAGAKIYVNGAEFTGDPKTIPLSNNKEIALVIGTPPASIPSTFG
jgi:hypothetical protein